METSPSIFNSIYGGGSEGLGPDGRLLRWYVIGTAKTNKETLSDEENGSDKADLLHSAPLTRESVENLFIDLGIDIFSFFDDEETAMEEWKNMWAKEAKNGGYSEYVGLGRDNLLGNGEGLYRWDIRRQRLAQTPEKLLNVVDSLSRGRAIQRLRIVWEFLHSLGPSLQKKLLPDVDLSDIEGFASLSDDYFFGLNWSSSFELDDDGKLVEKAPSLKKDDVSENDEEGSLDDEEEEEEEEEEEDESSGGRGLKAKFSDLLLHLVSWGNEQYHEDVKKAGTYWQKATNDSFSDLKTTILRYKYGKSPIPNESSAQACLSPTESRKFSLPIKSFGKQFKFLGNRTELGNLHKNVGSYWKKCKELYDLSSNSKSFKSLKIIKDLKFLNVEKPTTFWAHVAQGLFASQDMIAAPLKLFIEKINSSTSRRYLMKKNGLIQKSIESCILSMCLDAHEAKRTAEKLMDLNSSMYKSEKNDFACAWVLINSECTVKAFVYCQNWNLCDEGSILSVKANPLFQQKGEKEFPKYSNTPWLDGNSNEMAEINKLLNSKTLYVRFAGSTMPSHKVYAKLLEFFVFSEESKNSYFSIFSKISAISEKSQEDEELGTEQEEDLARVMSPNWSEISLNAQLLGIQRAISVFSYPNTSSEAEEDENSQENMFLDMQNTKASPITYSHEALSVFEFANAAKTQLSLYGPFIVAPKISSTKSAAEEYIKLATSSGILDHRRLPKSASLNPKLYWNSMARDPKLFERNVCAFFGARIYPTCAQMFGIFCIFYELLKENKSPKLFLSGGSLVADCIYSREDDGELTFLECAAVSEEFITSADIWNADKDKIETLNVKFI